MEVVHPMEYLRREYFEPAGLTQRKLAEATGMGGKTISELYTAKRPLSVRNAMKLAAFTGEDAVKLLEMQARYDVQSHPHEINIKPMGLPASLQKLRKAMITSLGRTPSPREVYDLLKGRPTDADTDLLRALFGTPTSLVVAYMADASLGRSHLVGLYEHYLGRHGGKPVPQVEKMLLPSDEEAARRLLDGEGFADAREFERFAFYRLRLLRQKDLFARLSEDRNMSFEKRARALYLDHFKNLAPGERSGEFAKRLSMLAGSPEGVAEGVTLYSKGRRSLTDECGGLDIDRFNQFVATGSW